jgi:hypothetical protein
MIQRDESEGSSQTAAASYIDGDDTRMWHSMDRIHSFRHAGTKLALQRHYCRLICPVRQQAIDLSLQRGVGVAELLVSHTFDESLQPRALCVAESQIVVKLRMGIAVDAVLG